MQRAARIGLWALVATAGAGGLSTLLRPRPAPTTVPAAVHGAESLPVAVAGYAELAVRSWLDADEATTEQADALFAIDPDWEATILGRRVTRALSAVAAHEAGPAYWAVTVAAVVDERGADDQVISLGTLFFEVGVAQLDSGSLIAMTEPAMVPGPTPPPTLPRAEGPGPSTPDASDPLTTTVDGFLQALLTGTGDVSRYLAPGALIAPVTPPPFAEVAVDRQAVLVDGAGGASVRAEVTARTAGDGAWSLSYQLELGQRDGRWEVRAISGAPSISAGGTAARDAAPADATSTTTGGPAGPSASEPGA
jgi:hypothetical protein